MTQTSGPAFPTVIQAQSAPVDVPALLVEALRSADAVVVEGAVPAGRVAALQAEAAAAHAAGRFAAARIGRARSAAAEVRGDATCWLDALDGAPETARFAAELERWREQLDRGLLLGARACEAHYARYPAGAAYARHRDRFADDDARVLSLVLYLNDGWTAADGGALRLYDAADRPHDLLPLGGRLVAFLSDRVEHEVLPAARTRWSVAAWLRRGA